MHFIKQASKKYINLEISILLHSFWMVSQVAIIYEALYTIQIVSKQLHSNK